MSASSDGRKAKRPEDCKWWENQRGRWVPCPLDTGRLPSGPTAAEDRIKRRGCTTLTSREQCVITDTTPDEIRVWCEQCPNSRFKVMLEPIFPPGASIEWLEKLVKQINSVFQDEFRWVPRGIEVVRGHKKHGDCVQCTYLFEFSHNLPPRLPVEHGRRLMNLIKAAAEEASAYPPLVSTMDGEVHDFADWGHNLDGEAEAQIYLELIQE